eukprot:707880-Amphidinium_carterae.1
MCRRSLKTAGTALGMDGLPPRVALALAMHSLTNHAKCVPICRENFCNRQVLGACDAFLTTLGKGQINNPERVWVELQRCLQDFSGNLDCQWKTASLACARSFCSSSSALVTLIASSPSEHM